MAFFNSINNYLYIFTDDEDYAGAAAAKYKGNISKTQVYSCGSVLN